MHTSILTTCTALLVLFAGNRNDGPLAVQQTEVIKPEVVFSATIVGVNPGTDSTEYLLVRAVVRNNTKEVLRYYSMSCSWSDAFKLESKVPWFVIEPTLCDKNVPKPITVLPGGSETYLLRLTAHRPLRSLGHLAFRLGMNLHPVASFDLGTFHHAELIDMKNVMWSGAMDVVEAQHR